MKTRICDLIHSTEFAEERLVASAQSELEELLIEKGWSKSDLAKAMGVTKARVSQIFSTNQNFTLRLLAKAFHALGDEIVLERASKKVYFKSSDFEEIDSRSSEDILDGFDWIDQAVGIGERQIATRSVRSEKLDESLERSLRNFRKHRKNDLYAGEISDENWGDKVVPFKRKALA